MKKFNDLFVDHINKKLLSNLKKFEKLLEDGYSAMDSNRYYDLRKEREELITVLHNNAEQNGMLGILS